MAGTYFSSIKMKRKDLDDVNHDFSDFSLSSPARKIRRLDVDLPPIMEEGDLESVAAVDQPSVAEEKEPMADENHERAIVLYNHVKNHPFLLHSPSDFTVSVDPELISGIKNQYLLSNRFCDTKANEEETTDNNNNNMAVVPWIPSQFHIAQGTDRFGAVAPELIDAELVGDSAMEIEGNIAETLQQRAESEFDGMRANEGLHQWQQQQQQHCFVPQLPYNTSAPISWSR